METAYRAPIDSLVTSHRTRRGLCLPNCDRIVDDRTVTRPTPIYRHRCAICEAPALTFDASSRALCSRHATVFIAAERVMERDDDDWWDSVLRKAPVQ